MLGHMKSLALTVSSLLLALACGSANDGDRRPDAGESGAPGGAGAAAEAGATLGGKGGADAATAGRSGGGGENGGATSAGQSNAAGSGGDTDEYAPEFSMERCVPKGPTVAEVPGVEVIAEYPEKLGDYLNAVALHEGTLYWAMWQDGIYRRAAGSAEPELVIDTSSRVYNMIATEDYLYWIQDNDQKLMRASLTTLPAAPEQILVDVRPLGLTADSENLYFIRQGEVAIFKLPFVEALPGGDAAPTALVSDASSAFMSPNSERLFYVTNQTLYSVPIAGGPVKGQGALGGLSGVLATDDALYIASDDDIYRREIDGPTNGTGNTPLARGNLASATSPYRLPLEEMRVEGDRLYYREEAGALAWVKTDGSDCRIVAKVPAPKRSENLQWVMDDTHFYVIQEDKKLLSIPK